MSYPVPAPARPPKHLFHFIIRYEGNGVVDENVVKAVQAQMINSSSAPIAMPAPMAARLTDASASSLASAISCLASSI